MVEIPLDHQQVYIASEDFDFEFEEADDDEAAEYQQLGLPLWTEVWFSELVICNFFYPKNIMLHIFFFSIATSYMYNSQNHTSMLNTLIINELTSL